MSELQSGKAVAMSDTGEPPGHRAVHFPGDMTSCMVGLIVIKREKRLFIAVITK